MARSLRAFLCQFRKSFTPSTLPGKQMHPEHKLFLTGQSDEACQIAKALGLDYFHIKSLTITIDPEHPITVEATFYPTEHQVKAMGGVIENFNSFGITLADIQFNYEREISD